MRARFADLEAERRKNELDARILDSDEYREVVQKLSRASLGGDKRAVRRSRLPPSADDDSRWSGKPNSASFSRCGLQSGSICTVTLRDRGDRLGQLLWSTRGIVVQITFNSMSSTPPLGLFLRRSLPDAFAAQHGRASIPSGSALSPVDHQATSARVESPLLPECYFFPPLDFSPQLRVPIMSLCAVAPHPSLCPITLDLMETKSGGNRKEEEGLRLGDTEIFQPYVGEELVVVVESLQSVECLAGKHDKEEDLNRSKQRNHLKEIPVRVSDVSLRSSRDVFECDSAPGGTADEKDSGETMLTTCMYMEFSVDPLDDADFPEGSPVCRRSKTAGRGGKAPPVLIPIALYVGRSRTKKWFHECLPLMTTLHGLGAWEAEREARSKFRGQANLVVAKQGIRRFMRQRLATSLEKVTEEAVNAAKREAKDRDKSKGEAQLRGISLEDEDTMAELAEERGISSILTLMGAYEVQSLKRKGLQTLAQHLSQKSSQVFESPLLENIVQRIVEVMESDWLGDGVILAGCLSFALLSMDVANVNCIVDEGGLRVIVRSLRDCKVDPMAPERPDIQFWALSALGNLIPTTGFAKLVDKERDIVVVLSDVAQLPLDREASEKCLCALSHVVRELFSPDRNLDRTPADSQLEVQKAKIGSCLQKAMEEVSNAKASYEANRGAISTVASPSDVFRDHVSYALKALAL